MNKGLKITLAIIAGVLIIVAVLGFVGMEEEYSLDHWIGNKTLFTMQAHAPNELILNYENVENDPEFVQFLRDPEKYSVEYVKEQMNY